MNPVWTRLPDEGLMTLIPALLAAYRWCQNTTIQGSRMALPVRSHLTVGIAVVAVAMAPSLAPPPTVRPIASPSIQLVAAVQPVWQAPKSEIIPTLIVEIQRGIAPSLGAPLPTPSAPTPAPAATNVNQAIKNIYNAAEPWVQYGFELATYAVGWVPYVGWLSPQIMIFYNFGERIVRSITFNLDDWIFGPLPFGQGLANVARDSWNALVQLGIDEWNFWLPPLPPLPPMPFATQTTAPAATAPTAQPSSARLPAERQLLSEPETQHVESVDGTPADAPTTQAVRVDYGPADVSAGVASSVGAVTKAESDTADADADSVETSAGSASADTPEPAGVSVQNALSVVPRRVAEETAEARSQRPTSVERASSGRDESRCQSGCQARPSEPTAALGRRPPTLRGGGDAPTTVKERPQGGASRTTIAGRATPAQHVEDGTPDEKGSNANSAAVSG